MITVGFDHFFLIITSVFMVVLMSLWGRHLWKTNMRQWNISEDSLCRCADCGYIFVAKRVETVTRCPACNELTRIRSKKVHKKMTY